MVFSIFIWSNHSYAEDADAGTGTSVTEPAYSLVDNSMSELEKIAVLGYSFIYYIGLLLGFFMFFAAIKRLLSHSKNPNDPRSSLGGVLILMIGFGALSSLQSSLSIGISTMNGGEQGHCFIYHNSVKKRGESFSPNQAECFDAKNSELTSGFREKLENSGKAQAVIKLMEKVNILFTILQGIGLAYFIKAIYTIKAIVEQTSQSTYGSVFIMLAVSSLVIDMPNTLNMIINTAKNIASVS